MYKDFSYAIFVSVVSSRMRYSLKVQRFWVLGSKVMCLSAVRLKTIPELSTLALTNRFYTEDEG